MDRPLLFSIAGTEAGVHAWHAPGDIRPVGIPHKRYSAFALALSPDGTRVLAGTKSPSPQGERYDTRKGCVEIWSVEGGGGANHLNFLELPRPALAVTWLDDLRFAAASAEMRKNEQGEQQVVWCARLFIAEPGGLIQPLGAFAHPQPLLGVHRLGAGELLTMDSLNCARIWRIHDAEQLTNFGSGHQGKDLIPQPVCVPLADDEVLVQFPNGAARRLKKSGTDWTQADTPWGERLVAGATMMGDRLALAFWEESMVRFYERRGPDWVETGRGHLRHPVFQLRALSTERMAAFHSGSQGQSVTVWQTHPEWSLLETLAEKPFRAIGGGAEPLALAREARQRVVEQEEQTRRLWEVLRDALASNDRDQAARVAKALQAARGASPDSASQEMRLQILEALLELALRCLGTASDQGAGSAHPAPNPLAVWRALSSAWSLQNEDAAFFEQVLEFLEVRNVAPRDLAKQLEKLLEAMALEKPGDASIPEQTRTALLRGAGVFAERGQLAPGHPLWRRLLELWRCYQWPDNTGVRLLHPFYQAWLLSRGHCGSDEAQWRELAERYHDAFFAEMKKLERPRGVMNDFLSLGPLTFSKLSDMEQCCELIPKVKWVIFTDMKPAYGKKASVTWELRDVQGSAQSRETEFRDELLVRAADPLGKKFEVSPSFDLKNQADVSELIKRLEDAAQQRMPGAQVFSGRTLLLKLGENHLVGELQSPPTPSLVVCERGDGGQLTRRVEVSFSQVPQARKEIKAAFYVLKPSRDTQEKVKDGDSIVRWVGPTLRQI